MPAREYDRLGLDDELYEMLGVRVPLIRMPVAPGRNLAILVEVAARNQLLRVARPSRGARALVDARSTSSSVTGARRRRADAGVTESDLLMRGEARTPAQRRAGAQPAGHVAGSSS